ncbi:hypothetical protein AUP43_01785 [Oceanibaculum pacificum]|uniref:Uncharacterized protein n=1 Tax=Oceanibaculum pacificum TaxID=580166 RepID=A0A154W465_9PROT|nr:hypothetical protein AUP43_01785 [Oceanibaculum pacificum]
MRDVLRRHVDLKSDYSRSDFFLKFIMALKKRRRTFRAGGLEESKSPQISSMGRLSPRPGNHRLQ